MKVNLYASELGFGNFCTHCMRKEVQEHKLQQVEFVRESYYPCSACGAKSE